jgi:uncharacterized protein (DUF305 family)
MRHVGRVVVGLMAAVLAVGGCASEERDAGRGGGGGTPAEASPSPARHLQAGQHRPTAADRAFIDGMTPHHEAGVAMAQDAIKRATRSELRDFARQMANEQREEIRELKRQRKAWFGSDQTPAMAKGMPALPAAGSTYDVQWARHMVRHHQQAIEMARRALREANAPETHLMAERILKAQTREQDQLKRWIREWRAKRAT